MAMTVITVFEKGGYSYNVDQKYLDAVRAVLLAFEKASYTDEEGNDD